jgi:tRNA(Ile)-lysidine synthase
VQLTAAAPTRLDLDGTVGEVLDQRLDRASRRPVALALSGGGDSVALLLAAARWAKVAGRPLVVLTVDHSLQPQSGAWTEACAAHAAALGADFRALRWTGDKPTRRLPAAARAARHALLADAAREADARVILMGHTADDVLEARAMRAAGATTPEPRLWGPSPAWPEGRGVFLLRPLLGLRRAHIRDWLATRGETWIEDPANADLRYARPRARRDLQAAGAPSPPELAPNPLAAICAIDAAGVLDVARDALRLSPRAEAKAFLAAACLCAAGTDRPPAGARVERLLGQLLTHADVTATLAGARIEADADEVRFMREPGEATRGGLAPLHIPAGATAVWDGRFEIVAERALDVRPLAGLTAKLPERERASLRAIAPRARGALPAAIQDSDVRLATARPLGLQRLHAACGLVQREIPLEREA